MLGVELFRDILRLFLQTEDKEKELNAIISSDSDDARQIRENLVPWCWWYDLSDGYLVAVFLHAILSTEEIRRLFASPNPTKAFLRYLHSDFEPSGWLDVDKPEGLGIFLSLVQAYSFNLKAYSMGEPSMNTLIAKVRDGDDEALLKAVYIDRAAIGCVSVSFRISEKVRQGDENFFDLLAKAIKRTRPHKPPKKAFGAIRFALAVLKQAGNLKDMSHKSLYELLVEDLGLYPEDGEDPYRSFIRLVQRFKGKKAT